MAEVDSIVLKVETETRKRRDGDQQVLVVKHKGKSWTVSKNNLDSVEVGKSYDFNLVKSEWKDSLYYWANLNEPSGQESKATETSEEISNREFFDYFKSFTRDQKIKAIKYFIDQI